MTANQIESIFKKHRICSWFEKFIYTDCKQQIINDLLTLNEKNKCDCSGQNWNGKEWVGDHFVGCPAYKYD